jgi:ABC-type sugar transport system ATPase subunit
VGAKAEIYNMMVDLARSGIAIIMISSEIPELIGMSDRIWSWRADASPVNSPSVRGLCRKIF